MIINFIVREKRSVISEPHEITTSTYYLIAKALIQMLNYDVFQGSVIIILMYLHLFSLRQKRNVDLQDLDMDN